jgi:hypothetical protein
MDSEAANQRELTFGEQAVGLSFNPSNNGKVHQLKELAAQMIDIVKEDGPTDEFGAKLQEDAIMQMVHAQMATVKSVTWHK